MKWLSNVAKTLNLSLATGINYMVFTLSKTLYMPYMLYVYIYIYIYTLSVSCVYSIYANKLSYLSMKQIAPED